MTPGEPAVCFGTVVHHRRAPAEHRFTYPVNQIWLDPDDPGALFDRHRLWSSTRPAPVRFRRRDYLDSGSQPIGPALRRSVEPALGRIPAGPIRMLTQARTWGWLFNPITVFLLWADDGLGPPPAPAAAVLEVTNTPWKERHRYPVALADHGGTLTATFDKSLHVSPFLDEDYRYVLRLRESYEADRSDGPPPRLTVELDVVDDRIHRPPPNGTNSKTTSDAVDDHGFEQEAPPDEPADLSNPPSGGPILTTRLVVDRHPATRSTMTRALFRNPLPTHRVSLGIHAQALRLWRKGVPFVAHPERRVARADGERPTMSDRR